MFKAGIVRGGKIIDENEWVEHVNNLKTTKKTTKEQLKKQIIGAVKKRIPKKRFGIFFSGGVDSSLIALICRQAKADFICYSVGLENAADIEAAKKAAKLLGVKLKYKIFSLKEAEKIIKQVTKIVGPDVVKVGVGSVVYAAAMLAKKDKINTFFSGLGSEEIFAGYERHVLAKDINKECWKGLKAMYRRDLLRDFSIAKELKINILTPFLDKAVIKAAMQIPGKQKINQQYKKVILRQIAQEIGLAKEIAWRKKKAAQYGSRFHKALKKLAKRNKFKRISEYLNQFSQSSKLRLGALISTGKDSMYAMYRMMKQGYELACIITLKSRNPDSFMFHTAAVEMAKLQSKAIGIPLIEQETAGEKEKELKDLKKALEGAKKEYKIEGVVAGALLSNYQKKRIEKTADSVGLKVFSPLWQINQEKLLREIINNGFKFILTKVSAEGLDKSWLNKVITEKDVDRLIELNKKIGINIAGEGGEYETLMVDGPIFKKAIRIADYEIDEESRIIATLRIKKAELL